MLIPNQLLPVVDAKYHKQGMGFTHLEARYNDLPMQPLQVTGYLLNGYIPSASNGALHLDGVLSSAVFAAHPCYFRMIAAATVAPLPLKRLWQSDEGIILYASGDFVPETDCKGQEYWHKRYPTDRNEWSKKLNANTTAGQYKDYRVPVDVRITPKITALCIGNQAEIERLLSYITHVGKKSSQGFGRVAKWEVGPADVTLDDILVNRPVPVASKLKSTGKIRHATWTSPYWYKPWAAECYV